MVALKTWQIEMTAPLLIHIHRNDMQNGILKLNTMFNFKRKKKQLAARNDKELCHDSTALYCYCGGSYTNPSLYVLKFIGILFSKMPTSLYVKCFFNKRKLLE
jgi:hypothetical protein